MGDNNKEDEDDLFGRMIAMEIKNLPQLAKVHFKHEVNNLVFKYKSNLMATSSISATPSPTAVTPTNNVSQPWYQNMGNYMN